MKNLFWGGIVLLAALAGCGSNESPTRPNDFTPLTSIEIVVKPPAIAQGTSTPLQALGNFSGLFTRDITAQVVWASSTQTIADFILPANRVKGINPGTATVTATMGTITASHVLTVTDASVTAMDIAPLAPSTPKGLPQQFAVFGKFSSATTTKTTQDLTFDANWASSDPAVASISNAVGSNGLAHALALGTTTITATFGTVSDSTQMKVIDPVLQSIAVMPTNLSLLTLSTGSFAATGRYSDGSTQDITSQVTWTSDPAIATIAGGVVSNLVQGTTSIGATLAGFSGSATLKVTGGNLTSIALTPANPTLVSGTSMPVTATGSFSNNTTRDITGKVTWSVDSNIATVDTSGGGNLALLNAKTVAVAQVPTTLSASVGTTVTPGKNNLTVTAPTLKSNSLKITPIAPFNQNLAVGTSGRFKVTGDFSDGTTTTTQDLTINADWTSSDGATATVGNVGLAKGRVTGIAAASVTITATYGGQAIPATVTVTQPTLKESTLGLTISPPSANFSAGTQLQFKATANYTNNSSYDVTEDVVWTISNSNVAILADSTNQPGLVVAVDSGTATLTAAFGGLTQTATLTVP